MAQGGNGMDSSLNRRETPDLPKPQEEKLNKHPFKNLKREEPGYKNIPVSMEGICIHQILKFFRLGIYAIT